MRTLLLASTAILIPALACAQDCTLPPAAVSAGFTTPTFRGTSLSQWKGGSGGSPGACGATQNSDGTIHIAGGGCNGFNDQITSAIGFGGGGYFEATLSFTGTPSGAGGWPAFWGNMGVGDSSQHNIEIDALEVQGGMITHGAFDWFGAGGSQTIATPPTSANNYMPPSGFSWAQPHRYGLLWIPATATQKGSANFYLDGQLQTGSVTWSPGGTFSAIDGGRFLMMLGTGPTNPMTIYDVGAWQKDGSKNSVSTGLPVNALTACRSTTFQSPASILSAALQQSNVAAAPLSVSDVAALAAGGGDPGTFATSAQPSIDPLTAVASVQPSDPAVAAIVAEAATRKPHQITSQLSDDFVTSSIPKPTASTSTQDPLATVVTPTAGDAGTLGQPTGNGSFLSLSGATSVSGLLAVMKQNADIARSESHGTMAITLAAGDLTPGTAGSVKDARGNVFTLPWKGGDWGSSMGQPTENGQPISDGTGWVAAIRIVHGVACFENAKGLGWGCQGSGTWVADPGPADPGSAASGLTARATPTPVASAQPRSTR